MHPATCHQQPLVLSPGRKPGEQLPEQRERCHLPAATQRQPGGFKAAPRSSSSSCCWQPFFPKHSCGAEGGRAQPSTAVTSRELHALPDATRGRRTHGLLAFPKSISGCCQHCWSSHPDHHSLPKPFTPPSSTFLCSLLTPRQPPAGHSCPHDPHSTQPTENTLTPNT